MNDPITFSDVLGWAQSNLGWIVALFCVFVEITPIKISPISWLASVFFKPIRSELKSMKTELEERIDSVKTELKAEINTVKQEQELQRKDINDAVRAIEMSEISRLRWEILEFANSIDNKLVHTRDEYRHIKDQSKKYHALIQKYKLDNGLIDEAMQKINNHYDKNKDSTSVYF